MRFSQKKGCSPIRVQIQKDDIDLILKNKLWTAVSITIFAENNITWTKGSKFIALYNGLWVHLFCRPIDTIPLLYNAFTKEVRQWFYEAEWYEVYDFIEHIGQSLDGMRLLEAEQYIKIVNVFLEAEMSGYRFVGNEIGEITNTQEITTIEEAIKKSEPLSPVHVHLKDALSKLINRSKPDYRNSIKESISAVEAACRLLTKDSSATLGAALKKIEDSGVKLHPALIKAWSSLYGFTNDANGIRHALFDEPNNSFGEAKYMLVSCSAFVNYLIELTSRAKIKL